MKYLQKNEDTYCRCWSMSLKSMRAQMLKRIYYDIDSKLCEQFQGKLYRQLMNQIHFRLSRTL